MLIILVSLVVFVGTIRGQNWAGTACLVNHHDYFMNVAQRAIGRIENEIQWSNLKLLDSSRNINTGEYDTTVHTSGYIKINSNFNNHWCCLPEYFDIYNSEQLFKWHARGTVNYTNGFTVAVQKIDVTNIQNIFSNINVDGITQSLASVRGLLHFRNLKIGYDVIANLEDSGTQRFTGLYMYTLLSIQYEIRKNVNTNEISVSSRVTSLSPGFRTMEYMPVDSVSEMLSRHFVPSTLWDSFDKWDDNYINPFMLDVAKNTEYPEIRFGTC